MTRFSLALLCLCLPLGTSLGADPAVVEAVVVRPSGMGWRFDVTVRHPDAGWDHFADQWQVLSSDGQVIATRVLAHPHEDEQPFTRSLIDVIAPDGTRQVIVRARCSQGDVSAPYSVTLSR